MPSSAYFHHNECVLLLTQYQKKVYGLFMKWTVALHRKVTKQVKRLPVRVKKIFVLLLKDIENFGPNRVE